MEEHSSCNLSQPLHVLVFPWLAQGHISAYAHLSLRLAHHAVNVSFLSTPLNIAKIKPFFANQSHIQLLQLPLPIIEGLPPEIESTADLPMHLTPLFNTAVDGLEKPFEKLLEEICPDCVVFDFVQWWAGKAAAKFGISCVSFATFGAAFTSYVTNPVWREYVNGVTAEELTRPPPGYPSTTVAWKLYEAKDALACYRAELPDTVSYNERSLRGFDVCDAVAVKACDEIEGKFVAYLREVSGKPVLPLGPLLPHDCSSRSEHEAHADYCMTWLDKQAAASVVYVSFGSQCFLRKEEIAEVAAGLEASGQPFLWALHMPRSEEIRVNELLPEGFEERIGSRGVVAAEWVSQREILAHPSTGGFMSHCGWNSVMEAMSVGLPVICSPVQFDQCHNARFIVEELKAGVEIGRGNDGSFDEVEICRAVKMAMGKEGKGVRAKAKEMREVFKEIILKAGGSQDEYIIQFVKHLKLLKESGVAGHSTANHCSF